MIEFQDFKHDYIKESLPKLYDGELDFDMAQIVWDMSSEECREFNKAAKKLLCGEGGQEITSLLEKLAIEYLSIYAKKEYKNMIAVAEDEAGEEEYFYTSSGAGV